MTWRADQLSPSGLVHWRNRMMKTSTGPPRSPEIPQSMVLLPSSPRIRTLCKRTPWHLLQLKQEQRNRDLAAEVSLVRSSTHWPTLNFPLGLPRSKWTVNLTARILVRKKISNRIQTGISLIGLRYPKVAAIWSRRREERRRNEWVLVFNLI